MLLKHKKLIQLQNRWRISLIEIIPLIKCMHLFFFLFFKVKFTILTIVKHICLTIFMHICPVVKYIHIVVQPISRTFSFLIF